MTTQPTTKESNMDKPASLVTTASVQVTVDLDSLADSFQAIADAIRATKPAEDEQSTFATNEPKESNMSIATKYRKKPVVVEAMQLTETNAGAVLGWLKSFGTEAIMRGGPKGGSVGATIMIKTLEGNHLCSVWDSAIRGVQDEAYPCKPDIFAATYEQVDS